MAATFLATDQISAVGQTYGGGSLLPALETTDSRISPIRLILGCQKPLQRNRLYLNWKSKSIGPFPHRKSCPKKFAFRKVAEMNFAPFHRARLLTRNLTKFSLTSPDQRPQVSN
jgi:hypothetical protein